ncbi:amidase [Alkalilimnicola ehrlichii MLHE-1]|uniref:Amidase n=1 Tax=Alkalilimnicola ehrlichii (strain ATCC BAA-1101 / DSM 17681 / MLHE-1) TaxID=187272 RepID=Q0A5U4_ALKEH|nr:amidase [Alkalilimnicola ehrlichii]ABI57793.1 Amidase [Alkalilimnicola ehrlichii MLHE-1]
MSWSLFQPCMASHPLQRPSLGQTDGRGAGAGGVGLYNWMTAAAAVDGLRRHELTSAGLVEACLERIQRRDDAVRAWSCVAADQALAAARQADEVGDEAGPLRGVPVGIKDIIDTADMATEYGSPLYRAYVPLRAAECVRRLRRAGAVILGKTVTTEFAFYAPGPTRNPHHPGHTPGGSSSGSAAAVADGQVTLALGTQTAGSVIRPAAFNGVLGYKPTFGAIPRAGVYEFARSLDTVGVFARGPEDLSLARQALSSEPAVQASAQVRPRRIAYLRTPMWSQGDSDMHRALDGFADALAGLGVAVEEPQLPTGMEALVEAQRMIMAREGSEALAEDWARCADGFSSVLSEFLAFGRTVSDDDYARACALGEHWGQVIDGLFADYDLILTPATPGEAPEGLESTGDPLFNRTWTLLGTPCVALPIGRGARDLPLAAQLVGRKGGDAALLAGTTWIFRALGLTALRPGHR